MLTFGRHFFFLRRLGEAETAAPSPRKRFPPGTLPYFQERISISMLLLNKTLLKLARGLWGDILAIAAVSFLTLVGSTALSEIVAGFLGSLFAPADALASSGGALRAARAGRTIYTPRLFYKTYRLLAKLMPSEILVKMVKT